jgi:hypothetical protein
MALARFRDADPLTVETFRGVVGSALAAKIRVASARGAPARDEAYVIFGAASSTGVSVGYVDYPAIRRIMSS